MPEIVPTGWSCPTCKRTTGDTKEVLSIRGKLTCSHNPAHIWDDHLSFIECNPTQDFKHEQPRPQEQPGHVPITVKVPLSVRNSLTAKYGDKADGIVAGILLMMAEGECLVVRETDLQRLSTVLPEKPKDSSHLFGMVMAKNFELEEAKQAAEMAAKEVKAYEGMSTGMVMVNLGDQYAAAQHRAQADGMPVKIAVEKWLRNGLENSWF